MLRKIGGRLLYLVIGVVAFVLCCVRGFALYDSYIGRSEYVEKRFENLHERAELVHLVRKGKRMRYLDIGDTEKAPVVLIHGAWGSINDRYRMLQYTTLFDQARFIVVDRLGYGGSGDKEAHVELDEQAEAIWYMVQHALGDETNQLPLVMGHSYGGTLVLKLMMLYPDQIRGGYVVAGAVDPEYEKFFQVAYIVPYAPWSWITPSMFYVTALEKLAHVEELENNLQDRHRIVAPVRVIHGDADTLVPVENVVYLEGHIDEKYLEVEILSGRDHPLQFTDADVLADRLESMIDGSWEVGATSLAQE